MKLVVFVLSCLLFTCSFAEEVYFLSGGSSGLDVVVQGSHYTILVDGVPWFNGTNAGFHSNGQWYESSTGTLKFSGSTLVKGTDGTLGAFTGVDITWMGGNIEFHTIFQSFEQTGVIVFNQYFPKGLPASSTSTNKDVLSGFPVLNNATSLYYFTYTDWPTTPLVGAWLNGFPSTIQGGAPALFYNQQLRSVLFSPLNNLMIGMQTDSQQFGTLAFGLNGMVLEIPANFTHRTIIVAGQGVNNTFTNWGDTLLAYNGKQRNPTNADVLIEYLGYWTDNGAYYYYLTEPNKTYSETMIDVYKYITSLGLPVKNYQFDSWWYFKGTNNGVSLWEPMPTIFPEGMLYVDQNMGNLPLALHNRYFAPNNQYHSYLQNYSFAVESYCALPLDEGLFTHIMGKAKGWGMVLYEQDWLVTTYMSMQATQNNVSNSQNWLLNMGNAAKSLGLTIQYCMPLPLHILQSSAIQVVTQSRVSNDYNPGNSQWQIGYPSILVWSLGVFPFKDDFWTSSNPEPGCRFSTCTEPNPVLETLVATLSTGPVGPSDEIGSLNVELIMHTCTATGLLLKADKPATALDTTFIPQNGQVTMTQVWDSFTQFGNNRWHYVLGAGLTQSFTIHNADLELQNVFSVAIDYFAFTSGTQAVAPFDNEHDLVIPNGQATLSKEAVEAGVVPFKYYVIAPILQSKWVLLGETGKFVTVSHQRITSLSDTPSALSFTLAGSQGESVSITLYNSASAAFQTITSTFSSTKSITITCSTACSTST